MNEEQKEKLKSAITINQKFDLKTSNKSNIYKGRKYKDFNKIKDNIPIHALNGKMKLYSESFNKLLNNVSRINLSHIEVKKDYDGISLIEIKNFRDEELSCRLEGSKINYMNVLNLMKDGFDFANLSNVKVSAELRPIFYDEKEEEENPDEYITII